MKSCSLAPRAERPQASPLPADGPAALRATTAPAHQKNWLPGQEIEEPERAAAYVKELRSRSEPIMGFGHRVYRAEDPRARHLREGVQRLSAEKGEPKWYAILEAVQKAMRPYGRLGVNVNVDFSAGVIYYPHSIPAGLVRADLRGRTRARLDRAGVGADGEQHPAAPAAPVRRPPRPAPHPDRGALGSPKLLDVRSHAGGMGATGRPRRPHPRA